MTTDGPSSIRVQLVYAMPGTYWSTDVALSQGATVADALVAAAGSLLAAGIVADPYCLAIFGKTVETRSRLRDGDRLELLRPLLVNPRDARSSRASAAGKPRKS